jgi:protein-disulfide isomerase
MKRLLPVSVLALALAACGGGADNAANNTNSTAANVAAPAGSAWTDTASETEAGGFLLGNPDAAVKLIEYGALSCGHCAEFSAKSKDKLKSYIAKGTVSYEFRPFLLNPLDVPASLLARCSGPLPFFTLSEQMFAAQAEWMGKAQSISQAEQQAWQGLAPEQLAPALATKLELDRFVQQRGIGSAQAKACLADKGAIDRLSKITQDGVKDFQISGTPTFIINGKTQREVNTWEGIEPLLVAAGA